MLSHLSSGERSLGEGIFRKGFSSNEATSNSPASVYPELFPSASKITELQREIGDPLGIQPTKRYLNDACNVFAIDIDGSRRCVKYGRDVEEREAMAMEYVRRHTTIPVPRVYWFWKDEATRRGFIVMDFIDAMSLESEACDMPVEQREWIASQIVDIVQKLRILGGKGPHTMGSWQPSNPTQAMPYSNTFYHDRTLAPTSTFRTMAELKQYWLLRWSANPSQRTSPPQFDVSKVPNTVVLTHGDLQPRNILVKNGSIVGIVDWDTLGWYPAFWEPFWIRRGQVYAPWQETMSKALDGFFGSRTEEETKFARLMLGGFYAAP